ncbi:MAG: aminopeptidase P family protein [Saprospiraceae bacterium]|nr:aminopeptidase P family protein [Saprospiraceae bacterium]
MFETAVYVNRRKKLLSKINRGVGLFLGNPESPRNYRDNVYPFRQDSNFLYFFGHAIPDMAALIDFESGETILFGKPVTLTDIIWMGNLPSLEELAAQIGATAAQPLSALEERIREALKKGRGIHFLPPYRMENTLTLAQMFGIPVASLAQHASLELTRAVIGIMGIKELAEIDEITKAINISGDMHVAAMRQTREGMKESDIVALITQIAIANGNGLSYNPIITINGQILHNHAYHNELKGGQLLLGDFGAEVASGYAGDITRTIPVSKQFETRQKDVYRIVLQALDQSIAQVAEGVLYRDVHLHAARIIAAGLGELGLMKGDPDAAVAAGAHALFFPHGLGHLLGLNVHDMEDLGENLVGYDEKVQRSSQFGLSSLRYGKALEAGMVLTVEPGIYFIPELIQLWKSEKRHTEFINYPALDAYLDFGGIRLEDNVLVHPTGSQVLGNPIPKEIDIVEMLRE